MVDRGNGPPLVLIPGVQGRWEWMGPAVDALAARCRVIRESLVGDAGGMPPPDPAAGFENHLTWVDELLDRASLKYAALCGVLYGGWIALHYAATRPERVTSLTLTSPPPPTWRPTCHVEWYLRAPHLLSPLFALSSPFRLYPEIAAPRPDVVDRLVFTARHLARVTRYPFAPSRMAERVRAAAEVDFAADCQRVTAPTHVVTGQESLDRVVPVSSTREYVDDIRGARYTALAGTGHIGLVTRPERFAVAVADFVTAHAAVDTPVEVPA